MLRPFFRFSTRRKPGWVAVCARGGSGEALGLLRRPGEKPRVNWAEPSLPASLDSMVKSRDLAGCSVTTLLAPGEYQLVQMDAPTVPQVEWKDALRWKLKDAIDFPVEQATFEVLDIPTHAFAPGRPRMVFVVVARNEVVAATMAEFAGARLGLAAIDIPELALRNVSALLEDENRGLACLSFDRGGGLLVLTFKGELYASRRIEVNLEQFSQADEDRRQTLFERIGLELQRTLDAFDRQYSFITITRLLLAPRPELRGLLDYLAGNLYVPVAGLDLSAVVDFNACPLLQQPGEQARVLLALGAALREEGGV